MCILEKNTKYYFSTIFLWFEARLRKKFLQQKQIFSFIQYLFFGRYTVLRKKSRYGSKTVQYSTYNERL